MFAVFVGCDGVVWDEGVAALFVARALVGWGEGGRDAVFARHVGDVDGVDARVAMLEFDGEVAVGCHVFGDGVAFVSAARNRERFERRSGRVNDEIDVGRKAACERQSGVVNGEREIVSAELRHSERRLSPSISSTIFSRRENRSYISHSNSSRSS